MYPFACVPLAKETEEHRSQFYLSFDLKCISFGAFKICAAVGLFFPLLCFVEFISSRQEYWSGLPFPPPGDLPDPGIELESPESLALAGRFFTASTTREESLLI